MQHQFRNVWYASYGSNLSLDRFLCYIQGGKPKGSSAHHPGCRDITPPRESKEILINHELYFARQSSSWNNGGVAFIRPQFNESASTLGRMYLITVEQLIDVVKQEIDYEGQLELDFNKAIIEGSCVFQKTDWYGNLIYLNNQNEFPIFTFTSENDILPYRKPSVSYLKTIIAGLLEAHHYLSVDEIVEYLITKSGVQSNYHKEELRRVIETVQS